MLLAAARGQEGEAQVEGLPQRAARVNFFADDSTFCRSHLLLHSENSFSLSPTPCRHQTLLQETFKNELGETLLNVKITIIAQLDDSVVRQISGPSVSCGVMYNSSLSIH